MAVSPKLAVRLDEDLLAWLKGYAAARHTTTSAVVSAALHDFRDMAQGGVQDLPRADGRSAPQGRVNHRANPSSRGLTAPAPVRSGVGAAPSIPPPGESQAGWASARQQKLNEAKYAKRRS